MEDKKLRYSIYFLLALALPGFGIVLPQSANKLLGGVEQQDARIPLTAETLWQGSFQQQFSQSISKSFLLRDISILTFNQLYLWTFAELSSEKVFIGKDQHLFHFEYLSELQPEKRPTDETLQNFARQLEAVRQRLKQHDVELLLLISASKPRVYPDFLPTEYERYVQNDGSGNAARLAKYLEETKVESMFTTERLKELRDEVRYPVYPKGGIHWSYAASCTIASELYQRIMSLQKESAHALACTPTVTSSIPNRQDSDIAHMANVWRKEQFFDPTYVYPKLEPLEEADSPIAKPEVVFVGSSFSFNLIYHLLHAEVFEDLSLLYYFRRLDTFAGPMKTNFSYVPTNTSAIQKSSFDWEREVLSKDIVVLEINEANIKALGYGFVEAFLARSE